MYKGYTQKKILELLTEDVAKCKNEEEAIKLRDEIISDSNIPLEDALLACIMGAVRNKRWLDMYRKDKKERAPRVGISLDNLNFFE